MGDLGSWRKQAYRDREDRWLSGGEGLTPQWSFGGVRDLVCMLIVATQSLGICENSELYINRMFYFTQSKNK